MRVIERTVGELDATLPLFQVGTLRDRIGIASAQERVLATLLAGFAGVALVLAAAGLYGLIAYMVSARTKEFGLRMALGARSGQVLALVHRKGILLTTIGLVLGLLIAFFATRALSALMFGIAPTDPITFVGVVVVLGAVALLAAHVPARRATRVDPAAVLRSD